MGTGSYPQGSGRQPVKAHSLGTVILPHTFPDGLAS